MAKAPRVHLDFETRSAVNLKKYGLDVYMNHSSTDAWCACYRWDGEDEVFVWRKGEPCPPRLKKHIEDGHIVVGHNVGFEWAVIYYILSERYDWPVLDIEQCDCTMARAYALALPGDLDRLGKALGVSHKDSEGKKLMLKMSKPRKILDDGTLIWWDEEDKIQRLIEYCKQDVIVECDCDEKLLPLSKKEKRLWLLDHEINFRGVGVDREALEVTQQMVVRVKADLSKQIRKLTHGEVGGVTEATKITDWCHERGVYLASLQKYELEAWLADPDIPADVREILELRSNAKASVTKLESALARSLVDSRVRGAFQYHGASTGRWAGRGVQMHNLARPEEAFEDPEWQDTFISDITNHAIDEHFIEEHYGAPMRVLSSCVRGYFVAAPGYEYIGADLKNIEGVGLAWLAGEEWKLRAFRENFFGDGPGIYELGAAKILGKDISDITKEERQVMGKVPELSMGYQGGVGAFQSMAVNYGVKISDAKADEIKVGWREANPNIKQYWYDTEYAAVTAVKNPGMITYSGARGRQVKFRVAGSFLFCQLPSGRVLSYPFPEIQQVETPWGEAKDAVTFKTIDSDVKSKTKGKFVRKSSYGGKFVENITQAFARDVLAHGMFLMEDRGYPIVLHVHDENVAEVKKGFGSVEEVESLMSQVPTWAKDLPLAADGFRGVRYRK